MKLVAFVLFIGIFAKQSIAGPLNSMDVIVVQQANGSFVSSPFHVRFGKSDLIAALSKTVTVKINGELMNVPMELGMDGKAYFLQEISEDEANEILKNLITASLPSADNTTAITQSNQLNENNSTDVPQLQNIDDASKQNLTGPSWWRRSLSSLKISKKAKLPDIEAQQSPTQMTYSDDPSDMTADYLKAATKLPKNVDNPIVSENDRKYRKTLQLTSEQIKSLNLKPGKNEMEISAGTFQSKCFLYAWRHTDKLVVSDVDGTITKSDFLGHFLPMIGRDWTQLGVAELFTKIDQNGYKFIYLSARPISQSSTTRDFLGRIQQENHTLPDGPVILNPTSLLSALHREVITGKPEQFKIASLNEIKALFPENPFFAGYGNRINDEWAYSAVGIPEIRIFTINSKGELKTKIELKQGVNEVLMSNYPNMTRVVDEFYPQVVNYEKAEEMSSFFSTMAGQGFPSKTKPF